MREYLFRGKRVDRNEWAYGSYLPVPNTICTQVTYPNSTEYIDLFVIPETVGQFTGLLDKNGKKIFEGDIVKTKYGRLCEIIWFSSRPHCGWDMYPVCTAENIRNTKAPDRYDLYKSCNLEVVGNIHDNPELLKAGDAV